jgi:DNA-binding response OmpR family regulator
MPLVLVADDDADIRDLLQQVLESAGFEVVAVGNGREALELARRRSPDALILDLVLPGLTGWEVAARLAREAGNAPPVVILSAAPPHLFSLPEGTVARFMRKPFDPTELVAVVRALTAAPWSRTAA